MGYLLTEIVVYLVIAGLIGFAFGWVIKAGALDKYFDKITGLMTKSKEPNNVKKVAPETVSEVIKEEVIESVEEVAPVKIAEEIKEEVKAVEPIQVETKEEAVEKVTTEVIEEVKENIVEETTKPTLLTEAPSTGVDKLSALKGIGPVLEKKLNELGVYTYEQIASWTSEQELWIGTQIAFPKKVTKEEWVKQAKELLKNK